MGDAAPCKVAESGEKETTKASKSSLSKLRDRARNTAQLSLLILMDTKIARDVGLLQYCVKPIAHSQSILCKTLKSTDAAASYYVDKASMRSEFLHRLGAIIRPFFSLGGLVADWFCYQHRQRHVQIAFG